MKFDLITIAAVACITALTGCATQAPAGAGAGSSVRAIMASQVVPPQPQAARGADGNAAVAGYANYLRSYTSPTSHSDSVMVGSGLQGK